MHSTAGCSRAPPTLLVRRAVLAGEQHVTALLRDVPVGTPEVADLIRHHGVFVLADLTLPLSARPVAAAAFRYHRPTATAQLAGIGVLVTLRRRGLGGRLLTGALTLLRAEGFAQVHALRHPPASVAPSDAAGSRCCSSIRGVSGQVTSQDGQPPGVSDLDRAW